MEHFNIILPRNDLDQTFRITFTKCLLLLEMSWEVLDLPVALHGRVLNTPKEVKAIAIRKAVTLLKAKNLDNVLVETDAFLVVQGLSYFVHFSISFVKQLMNQTTHLLARESVSKSDCMKWCVNPPSFLCNPLLDDMN